MSVRRRVVDAVRRRVVPSAAELDELRERVRVREQELAEARKRVRALERQLDQEKGGGSRISDQVRKLANHPAQARVETPSASGRGVHIVTEECVGCGTCVDLAPDAFQMDRSAAVATVVSQDAPADQVEEAVSACPTQCIHWSES